MWAVVAVIGMCLVKREEKHHIRYQFKIEKNYAALGKALHVFQ